MFQGVEGAMVTTYTRRNAEDILRAAGIYQSDSVWGGPPLPTHDGDQQGLAVLNAIGVWPHESIVAQPGGGELCWKPAWELAQTPGAPDPREVPGLPFPFSAGELAAWMLGGLGYFVLEAISMCNSTEGPDVEHQAERPIVDYWAQGPTADCLTFPEFAKAREAVEGAYAAYWEAVRAVGPFDPDGALKKALDQAHLTREGVDKTARRQSDWRDRSVLDGEREDRRVKYLAAVKTSRQAAQEANRAYSAAYGVWRRAMVQHLLRTSQSAPPKPKRVLHQQTQQTAILEELVRMGVDPMAVPRAPIGRTGGIKSTVQQALQLTDAQMKKAWQALRDDGRIADGPTD